MLLFSYRPFLYERLCENSQKTQVSLPVRPPNPQSGGFAAVKTGKSAHLLTDLTRIRCCLYHSSPLWGGREGSGASFHTASMSESGVCALESLAHRETFDRNPELPIMNRTLIYAGMADDPGFGTDKIKCKHF